MQLTLAGDYSLATMAAVAAIAMLLVGLLYVRVFGMLRIWQRWTLLCLRAAAILLIVVLLFRPVLSYQSTSADKPAVLFLLDKSRSMSIADDEHGRSRFQQAGIKLQQWYGKLRDHFQLLTIAFAEGTEVHNDSDPSKLVPDGEATSLCKALIAAKQIAPAEVAAVVVLSDGIHNTSGNPVDEARSTGLKIHTVGVGASLRSNRSYRDVQVVGITCPDRMLLGNTARVTGSIEAIGLPGRVIPVVLEQDGEKVAETELTLDDVGGAQTITFDFQPNRKGKHLYTVRVFQVAGERIVENNQRSAVAMVSEASIRVLYIEGTLRTEYGAMVDRFLARDPDLEFCALVQTRPNVFLQRSNMAGLRLSTIPSDQKTVDKFDVFILGDIDHSYLKPAQQEMLLKRVREGAGLIMLGGYHSLGPGGYTEAPIGSALPVELGGRSLGQYLETFLPTLTPEGVRHPIFASIADFFPSRLGGPRQPGLPTLDGCTRVGAARPGASVLATVADENATMPVLAVQPLDKGRTAVFTADTTRKWQQGPEAMDRDSPFLRFWGQTVRWLAGRSNDMETQPGIEAQTDKAGYTPGETVCIAAVVRTPKGQGANDAVVHLAVQGPGEYRAKIPMALVPGPSGHYRGTFRPTIGHYELTVEAQVGDVALTSEKMVLSVGRTNLEFERLDLDDKTLAGVAAVTGGRYVPVSTSDPLIEDLERGQKRKIVVVERPLYWPAGFWTAFVLILSIEWVLRRKFHLR